MFVNEAVTSPLPLAIAPPDVYLGGSGSLGRSLGLLEQVGRLRRGAPKPTDMATLINDAYRDARGHLSALLRFRIRFRRRDRRGGR